MSGRIREHLTIVSAAIAVLFVAEMMLRLVPWLPEAPMWPTPEGEVKHRHLVIEQRHPDLVFMGSSGLEAAVDPLALGPGLDLREPYNLAMPFNTFATYDSWYSHVLADRPPDLVVIGVPRWYGTSGLDEAFLQASEDALSEDLRDSRTPGLYGLRGALRSLDHSLARRRLLSTHPWTEQGHQTAYYNVEPLPRERWRLPDRPDATSVERAGLVGLIDSIQRGGSTAVLMLEPLAPSIAPRGPAATDLIETVRQIATTTGTPFWEPPLSSFPDALFVDGVHMTHAGTDAFSAYVGEMIRGLLSDRSQ